MVIEWLKMRVAPELREKFIQKDAEIWTAMLRECPGFLGKEVWVNPESPTDAILVIRWASREQWKSIAPERLERVEQQFDREFGEPYQLVEASEYQVRKFPQMSD
jgi:uncharacterized protein (TIGR03792 family)